MTDNSGLKVGLGMTALAAASACTVKPMTNKAYKTIVSNARKYLSPADAYEATKPIFEARKAMKGIKLSKPLLIAIPLYLGCGAIVDWANRNQRKNSEANAKTANGNSYTKVDMGKKLGAVLGLAAYGLSTIANKAQIKEMLKASPNKAVTTAIVAIAGALGGFTLGAIADKMSNAQAAKEADKKA